MSNILILYSTTDGHTLTICKRIENYLNQKSKVSLIPLTECTKKDLPNILNVINDAALKYKGVIPENTLLENGDIIFTSHRTPLVRIDKCSKLIWYNDDIFHHMYAQIKLCVGVLNILKGGHTFSILIIKGVPLTCVTPQNVPLEMSYSSAEPEGPQRERERGV